MPNNNHAFYYFTNIYNNFIKSYFKFLKLYEKKIRLGVSTVETNRDRERP